MGRDVPIKPNLTCDECGKVTDCFDFMGDFYCPPCADKLSHEHETVAARVAALYPTVSSPTGEAPS
jgi:hypothetical protein